MVSSIGMDGSDHINDIYLQTIAENGDYFSLIFKQEILNENLISI